MITASRIEAADAAEEQSAGAALRLATTSDELVSVWWRDCERFTGDARARLQSIYAECLTQFAPMQKRPIVPSWPVPSSNCAAWFAAVVRKFMTPLPILSSLLAL